MKLEDFSKAQDALVAQLNELVVKFKEDNPEVRINNLWVEHNYVDQTMNFRSGMTATIDGAEITRQTK